MMGTGPYTAQNTPDIHQERLDNALILARPLLVPLVDTDGIVETAAFCRAMTAAGIDKRLQGYALGQLLEFITWPLEEAGPIIPPRMKLRVQEVPPINPDILNHPLFDVFMEAIVQAMYGKGERHGGATIPFMEQQWVHKAKTHGNGFLTGQSSKKVDEAAARGEYDEAFFREVLGAINYAGMAYIDAKRRQRGK
jgi:hypothetical protein